MLKIILYNLILLFKMKCSKCGFENKDNAKFCTKCGGKLIEENNPPAVNQSSNNCGFIDCDNYYSCCGYRFFCND